MLLHPAVFDKAAKFVCQRHPLICPNQRRQVSTGSKYFFHHRLGRRNSSDNEVQDKWSRPESRDRVPRVWNWGGLPYMHWWTALVTVFAQLLEQRSQIYKEKRQCHYLLRAAKGQRPSWNDQGFSIGLWMRNFRARSKELVQNVWIPRRHKRCEHEGHRSRSPHLQTYCPAVWRGGIGVLRIGEGQHLYVFLLASQKQTLGSSASSDYKSNLIKITRRTWMHNETISNLWRLCWRKWDLNVNRRSWLSSYFKPTDMWCSFTVKYPIIWRG